jgi:hypothetical protein
VERAAVRWAPWVRWLGLLRCVRARVVELCALEEGCICAREHQAEGELALVTVIYLIEGMTCDHCVRSVTEQVSKVPV